MKAVRMALVIAAKWLSKVAAMLSVNRVPQEADRAARWGKLDQTLVETRSRFSDLSAAELHEMIDEAVTAARHG